MKVPMFIFAALTAMVIAQPHGHHHRHHKRDLIYETDVVTDMDVVTAAAPTVIVYVDGNGNPVATEYPTTATSEPATTAAPSENIVPSSSVAPTPSSRVAFVEPNSVSSSHSTRHHHKHKTSSVPAPSVVHTSTSTAPSTTASSISGSGPNSSEQGIAYSPYNGDGSCKTQEEIDADFESITGYSMVRIYGTDCNQTATVLSAASAKGIKLFAGVFDITQVPSEIQLIVDAAQHQWDAIDTVSIGNEGVNDGTYTVAQAVAAVNSARSLLKQAGYPGKVVTVDTFVAIINNPELCQVSDYAAANCHAFFDGGQTAAEAGSWTAAQAQRVSQACGGKDTVITEAGWPWQGETNGAAVPSVANQATAIASLKENFSSNIILFTAFDDMWKQNTAATFDAEQFWGFLNHDT